MGFPPLVRPCYVSSESNDLRGLAARLLITPSALEELSEADAAAVVDAMRPRMFPAGAVIMQEGDATDSDFMLLVLEGEFSVENHHTSGTEDMVLRLMGPGSLIGEMSLLDGAPRSASCVAHTDLLAAELRRDAFLQLIHDQPEVGVRLLLAIAKRMADHLRDATRKLKLMATMNRALSDSLAPRGDDALSGGEPSADPVAR